VPRTEVPYTGFIPIIEFVAVPAHGDVTSNKQTLSTSAASSPVSSTISILIHNSVTEESRLDHDPVTTHCDSSSGTASDTQSVAPPGALPVHAAELPSSPKILTSYGRIVPPPTVVSLWLKATIGSGRCDQSPRNFEGANMKVPSPLPSLK